MDSSFIETFKDTCDTRLDESNVKTLLQIHSFKSTLLKSKFNSLKALGFYCIETKPTNGIGCVFLSAEYIAIITSIIFTFVLNRYSKYFKKYTSCTKIFPKNKYK